MEELLVIKIGGNIIDDEEALSSFLPSFASLEQKKILVHGGGKLATDMAGKLGVPQQMVEGRRITDMDTLRIVTMVYSGLINKNIVAKLQALSVDALGLSGADIDLIRAHKRTGTEIDYGYVGDIDLVNNEKLESLLNLNLVPVVSSIVHDGKGQLLNSNADTIAGEIAKSLSSAFKVCLVYCFEKTGVLSDPADDRSVIRNIDEAKFKQLQHTGQVSSGMIPKLHNSLKAVKSGVDKVIIGHARDLPDIISGKSGTLIH